MYKLPFFVFLASTLISVLSCAPTEELDGCDTENDCFSLVIDGEDFYASATSATVVSLLGNSTITIQGNTDVSSSQLLAMAINIVNPVEGDFTINAVNSSQKSLSYYDESGNKYIVEDGELSILQYDTEDVLIEGTFSGEATYNNDSKTFTNGYFIVNQTE